MSCTHMHTDTTLSTVLFGRFPNGCGYKSALKEGSWDAAQLPQQVTDKWVVWHAACIVGMQQKLSALTGLLTALKGDTTVPIGLTASV